MFLERSDQRWYQDDTDQVLNSVGGFEIVFYDILCLPLLGEVIKFDSYVF